MAPAMGMIRRAFLAGAAAAVTAPHVVTSGALGAGHTARMGGRPPASDRITIGFIGLGGQGIGRNLRGFLSQPDCQAVAACDVDRNHRYRGKQTAEQHYARQNRAGEFKGCDPYNDWREVLGRRDIDTVCISTPDHWHVPMSVAAVRTGKDVICEKPTLTVRDGRTLADTVHRYGAVFQTATEDRSVATYHRMAELVRNGRIGRLQRIRVTAGLNPPARRPVRRPVRRSLGEVGSLVRTHPYRGGGGKWSVSKT